MLADDAFSNFLDCSDCFLSCGAAAEHLIYILEKGGRKLIVIGAGNRRGSSDSVFKNWQNILEKGSFRQHIRIGVKRGEGRELAKRDRVLFLFIERGQV